ncbi:MAG: rod shape-determining protein RodA [Bacteroidota bacterium]|nr:rod shape-determining protein RodA [Bacteroidota bacterium]
METPRRSTIPVDFPLILATIALCGMGLASIYSATHGTALFQRFEKQIFWDLMGILTLAIVAVAPPRFFHYSAYPLYGAGILSLVLVLLFGKTVAGNAGWFGIGPFGVQPSEFAKVTTIIALSRYVSESGTTLRTFREIAGAFAIVGLPWGLILIQPDFGTGIVYWASFFFILLWVGTDVVILLTFLSPVLTVLLSIVNLWLFLGFAFGISVIFYLVKKHIGFALLFLVLNLSAGFSIQYLYDHIPEHQKARIAVFLDPSRSPRTSGYNVLQSKVAIGAGGLTGKGYMRGTQTQLRFVPEQSTDFIFCVPAEEFGFVGVMLILSLYGVIVFRGLRIALRASFRFSSVLAFGATSTIFFHVVVNVGMAAGILPVIGIPLPFMSYGGSFTITSMALVGLLQHIHYSTAQTK